MSVRLRLLLRALALSATLLLLVAVMCSGSIAAQLPGLAGLGLPGTGPSAEVANAAADSRGSSATAATGDSPANLDPMEQKLLALLNTDRAARGLQTLELDSTLEVLARARSHDMATRNYFAHVTPEGTMVFNTLDQMRIPYKLAGENLARNAYPPDESPGVAHQGLMDSPKHAENDYDPDFNKIGIGVAVAGNGTIYFTELFAILNYSVPRKLDRGIW